MIETRPFDRPRHAAPELEAFLPRAWATKCLAHRASDAADTVSRAPRIGSRDAEFAGRGTNAAFATASALSGGRHRLRSFIQRGNWPNLAQFVIGLIVAPTLVTRSRSLRRYHENEEFVNLERR